MQHFLDLNVNIIKAKTTEEMKCSMLLYLNSDGFLQQDPNKIKKILKWNGMHI